MVNNGHRRRREEVKGIDRKIGRLLGKAFGKIRRTKTWKDMRNAYQEGLKSDD